MAHVTWELQYLIPFKVIENIPSLDDSDIEELTEVQQLKKLVSTVSAQMNELKSVIAFRVSALTYGSNDNGYYDFYDGNKKDSDKSRISILVF